MPLRKSTGNMYPWVTHTWNPIFGKCSHDCGYCYMRRWKLGTLKFDHDKVKSINLGEGKTIFIGSGTDMFAGDVPCNWISEVLVMCHKFNKNTYLFQSKNPERFFEFFFPTKTIYGTTIESNRTYGNHNAPSPYERAVAMSAIKWEKTVTIEPIMDFDIQHLVSLIHLVSPKFVSIGADSKGHRLPEPSYTKVQYLIEVLEEFTEVRVKHNLDRLKKNNS